MNRSQLQTLRDALAADTLACGWPAMDADAAAASMNAQTVATRRPVPLWEVYKLAIESGFLLAIQSAEAAGNVAAKLVTAYMANPRFDFLDLDEEAAKTVLATLVVDSSLTAEQAGAINALADAETPYPRTLGLGTILPGHITKARAL